MNIKEKLKKILTNYETYLLLFVFIFLLINKISIINPYLIWKIDKQDQTKSITDPFHINKADELKKKFYYNDNKVCFFNNKSKLISQFQLPHNIILSGGTGDPGIITYTQNGDSITYIHRKEGKKWTHKTYSYPFLRNNKDLVFLITGENGGYEILNTKGEVIAEPVSSGMFLTSFDIADNTNRIIIGYANGYIKAYNAKLKELWFKQFLNSKIQIVKKTAVSANGNFYAVLSGLKPEFITLLDEGGSTVWEVQTKENRRRPIDLVFSNNEEYLLEESDTGIRLYSTKKKKLILTKTLFPKSHKRKLISMDISYDGEYMITAHRENKEVAVVELFNKTGSTLFRLFYLNEKPLVKFSCKKYNFQIETENTIYLYNI